MNNNSIRITPVSNNDIMFLYKLLKNRNPNANISHRSMPTYKEHEKFVLSKPYSKWYIIFLGNKKIGSAYLTNLNEIGLHLKREFDLDTIKKQILNIVYNKTKKTKYFVNISPKNKKQIEFFKKNNFRLIQHTYELEIGNI